MSEPWKKTFYWQQSELHLAWMAFLAEVVKALPMPKWWKEEVLSRCEQKERTVLEWQDAERRDWELEALDGEG